MKKTFKALAAVLLVVSIIFSLAACSSGAKLTQENVIKTVETVETALKEFDTDTLQKYVSSATLDYIIKFSENHEQFAELGRAIFRDLEMEVESVDLENQTVTVTVRNKKLTNAASSFSKKLKERYSSFQLLQKLNDESFLDSSLGELVESIADAQLITETTVTLNIEQGKKNLILSFDTDAEDAVSGGALQAIKKIFG